MELFKLVDTEQLYHIRYTYMFVFDTLMLELK